MQRMHFFKFISSSNFQNKKAFKGTVHIYSNNMIITSELIGTELILCNFKRLATYTASSVYSSSLRGSRIRSYSMKFKQDVVGHA